MLEITRDDKTHLIASKVFMTYSIVVEMVVVVGVLRGVRLVVR